MFLHSFIFSFLPALHRNSTFQQVVSTQLPNGDGRVSDGQSSVVIIPTIVGESLAANQEGARVHLSDLEVRFSKNDFFIYSVD